jgi:hypothetical protein
MPTEVTKAFFEVRPKPFDRWDYFLCAALYLLIGIALVPAIAALIASACRLPHRIF